MKIAHTFEIKIALLGNVSAGKTTVLNALFRDKYGEVSMKRTTAGVNFFRISCKSKLCDKNKSSDESMEWSMVADDVRTAASIHKEIAADNAVLRESNQVEEKAFDIELDEDLVKMRKDTKLVVVDIPGINEAGSSKKYKDYVAEKWDTFDCIVVVMDGRQGVNTDEQVDLLKFVKTNVDGKKNMPVVILCNKVDDPDDEEQAELVREARGEVERVFGAANRKNSLQQILEASKKKPSGMLYPVFIPVSAVNAFIHQSASLMTFDQFKKFDKDLIEKLGRDQIGKKRWRKMSYEIKYKEAFKVITDPTQYQEGMKEANFDKFLNVLAFCCGGIKTQGDLIVAQLEIALKSITFQTCISTQLLSVHEKIKAVHDKGSVEAAEASSLVNTFWQIYNDCEDASFEKFSAPEKVNNLTEPMEQLIAYRKLIQKTGWKEEQDKIIARMKDLVRRQIGILFEKETVSSCTEWRLSAFKGNSPAWKELTPRDWVNIFRSMTLLSYDKHYCGAFAREQILMDELVHMAFNVKYSIGFCADCGEDLGGTHCGSCKVTYYEGEETPHSCYISGRGTRQQTVTGQDWKCSYCNQKYKKFSVVSLKRKYNDGKFEPVNAEAHKHAVCLEMPESFSDPQHFGHIAWKYCQFMASLEKTT